MSFIGKELTGIHGFPSISSNNTFYSTFVLRFDLKRLVISKIHQKIDRKLYQKTALFLGQ